MKILDFKIHSEERLDVLLADCIELLFQRQRENPEYWGLVSAAIMDPDDVIVFGVNHVTKDGTRKHAERVAMENYQDKFGRIPPGCIIVTTLSPCSSDDMKERWGESCTLMLDRSPISKVYAGWADPTQIDTDHYRHKRFRVKSTKNPKLRELCKKIGEIIIR
jgi:pyrimidine deaminase RibD-like protein